MKDTIIFIDSYISDLERSTECYKLINQLKKIFPDYKIGLLNKYPDSFKLDSLVDYYFYYGNSVVIGEPPNHLLEEGLYEMGYIYKELDGAVVENWIPTTGVTDHVASIYNSFIITSRIAKSLGFKKVFKVEYDTDFDLDELKSMKDDVDKFKDYLLHGSRNEKNEKKITDVHSIGYSVNLFDGFELILNENDYWELCKRIGYYGKWIEYVIPSIIKYQNNKEKLEGIVYDGKCALLFPKTKWDTVNSPSLWTERWENVPKVCSFWKNDTIVKNKLVLFYCNDNPTDIDVLCIVTDFDGNEVFNFNLKVVPHTWYSEVIDINSELTVNVISTREGITNTTVNTYTPEDIHNSNLKYKLLN